MSHRRSRRILSFSNICSLLALVVALGTGTAFAAGTIFSTDIVDGQVKNVDLAGNSVSTDKIAGSAVHASDITTGAITAPKLAPGAVTSPAIAYGAVSGAQISDDSVDSPDIVSDAIHPDHLSAGAVLTDKIADGAVTTAKVADDSLSLADLVGADAKVKINLWAGALKARDCGDMVVDVAGAQVGQMALLTLGGPIPANGMQFTATRVPSNGHVTVTVCNGRDTATPAISDLDARVVTFG